MPTKPKDETRDPSLDNPPIGGTKEQRMARHAGAQDVSRNLPDWDKPRAKYADDDQTIDARMWRLKRDHVEMGSR